MIKNPQNKSPKCRKREDQELTGTANSHFCSIKSSSPKRRRSREAKRPVGSREASWRRSPLMFFMRSVRVSRSPFRANVSSWRSWIRYFWPNDQTLRSKIPVIAKNCMKLFLCFFAFANKLGAFLGFCAPAVLCGAEDAMD
jgi:hypothetical protein